MAINRFYALHDKQLNIYHNPVACLNDMEACRLLSQWVNDKEKRTNAALYPEHYEMCYMFSMDDQNGQITQDSSPNPIMAASSAKEKAEVTYSIADMVNEIRELLKNETK